MRVLRLCPQCGLGPPMWQLLLVSCLFRHGFVVLSLVMLCWLLCVWRFACFLLSLRSRMWVRSSQRLSLWLSNSASGPRTGNLSSLAISFLTGLCSLLLPTPPFHMAMALVWGWGRSSQRWRSLICNVFFAGDLLTRSRLLCLLQMGMQRGYQGAHGKVEDIEGPSWVDYGRVGRLETPSLSLLASTPLLWSLGSSSLGFYNREEEFSGRGFSRGNSSLCFSLSCSFR